VRAALLLALTAAGAQAAPVDYQLTPTHSFVHFEWSHLGLSTLSGRFDKLSGRVQMDRVSRSGSGTVEVRLDSINTGRASVDAALREALGATGEASTRFQIDRLRFDGDRPAAAIGRWSWRERSVAIELQAVHFNCYLNPLLRREVCGGDFEASIDPAAIGLVLPADLGLQGLIRLRVQVEAIRQEAGE
jgi:polyisoprenoid-binding protein YceI